MTNPQEAAAPNLKRPLRFGIFLAPFHPVDEHPSLALERDFELVEHLDRLGYDEAWIGEHHSGGYELIASPELFIAAAAGRTRTIRLGTGVSSLPYHHPLMLADRIIQLSHITRGRLMFGVGPGALPSDAAMMGIDPLSQRDRMEEAIDVLVQLFRGEVVTKKTDWFELVDARLQLFPYGGRPVDMSVASMVSPAGARAAGKYGLGLLAIGATTKGGFSVLKQNWSIAEERAREFGHTADRSAFRLVGPMYVAESREEARRHVKFGIEKWLAYFNEVAALPLAPPGDVERAIDVLVESGLAVIGTPDDAAEQIRRLEEETGGFGAMLIMATNWASFENMKRSYELLARYVFPRFQRVNENRAASMAYCAANRTQFMGQVGQAVSKEVNRHFAEKNARTRAKE